jgi:hypothetical protein
MEDTDMSGTLPPGGGIFTIFAIGVRGLLDYREASKLRRAEKEAREALRDAERAARAAERASRDQQRQWYENVARQNVHGTSRYATEAEARAALRGKGGRPNELDKRKFR